MESLGLFELAGIAAHLGRRQCIVWSRCSKWLHTALQELCDLRLTEQQAELVKRICALSFADWTQWMQDSVVGDWQRSAVFPASFTIATGPSTGKTALALYTAAKLHRQGKSVFLVVPLKLTAQWRAEHEKFQRQFQLPELAIVHKQFHGDWRDRLEQGALPLVPKSTIVGSEFQKFLSVRRWTMAIVDEASIIQRGLLEHCRRDPEFYLVGLNASRSGETIASHAIDEQLGELPSLRTVIQVGHHWFKPGTDQYAGQAPKYREAMLEDLVDLIETVQAKKLMVLLPTNCNQVHNTWRQIIHACDAKGPLVNLLKLSGTKRTVAVQQFNELKEGILLGPLDWLSRGFNLPCQAMIVLDDRSRTSASTWLQLVGRLRRVESPFRQVQLHILQGMPIHAREIGFHALYAGGNRSNKKLLRLANWISDHPSVLVTAEGKRRPLPYCRNLEEFEAMFRDLFPEDAKCIKEVDAHHLIVETH